MEIVHVELKEANAFIESYHRHHKPVIGHRFSIGAKKDGRLVGVAIIGRPVARKTDWYTIVEVTRLCTDGTKNACSFLYSAAARCAKELGYKQIQTFILDTELGTSLIASGWKFDGITNSPGKKGWHTRDNRKIDQPTCTKHRYIKIF